jgi:hypothetical protein
MTALSSGFSPIEDQFGQVWCTFPKPVNPRKSGGRASY